MASLRPISRVSQYDAHLATLHDGTQLGYNLALDLPLAMSLAIGYFLYTIVREVQLKTRDGRRFVSLRVIPLGGGFLDTSARKGETRDRAAVALPLVV